jgi:hypothetical protein
MDEDEKQKAEEILKKRRLAAKGLKERPDGKAVDPLEDIQSLDPEDKDMSPDTPEKEMEEATDRATVAGLAFIRNR